MALSAAAIIASLDLDRGYGWVTWPPAVMRNERHCSDVKFNPFKLKNRVER